MFSFIAGVFITILVIVLFVVAFLFGLGGKTNVILWPFQWFLINVIMPDDPRPRNMFIALFILGYILYSLFKIFG